MAENNKHITSFEGGLNKDLSLAVIKQNQYTDCENFRLISDKGKSSFSIENTQGTTHMVSIPDTSSVVRMIVGHIPTDVTEIYDILTITVGTTPTDYNITISGSKFRPFRDSIVEALNNNSDFVNNGFVAVKYTDVYFLIYNIGGILDFTVSDGTYIVNTDYYTRSEKNVPVGHVFTKDHFIIITTNNNTDVYNGNGQIWDYDILNQTIRLLYYVPNLGLSLYHTLHKVCAIYETDTKWRIYWTDNHNSIKTFNIGNPDCFGTPVTELNLVPHTTYGNTILQDIVTGELPVCTIQVAYRLLSKDGAITTFSPPSIPINLLSGNIYTHDRDYPYNEEDALYSTKDENYEEMSSEKAVHYKITVTDDRFEFIQLAYIIYQKKDNPEIRLLDVMGIPDPSDNIGSTISTFDYTINGNEFSTILTQEEFNLLSSPFDTAKDLVIKNNKLFVFNTTKSKWDTEYDARVYRFDSHQTCKILTKPGNPEYITIDGTSPVWPNLIQHEQLDAINNYNNETISHWSTDWQFKYQTDGSTLGGEGPNVKYKFHSFPITCDTHDDSVITDAVDDNTSGYSRKWYPQGIPFIKTAVENHTLYTPSGVPYPIHSFSSPKSPYISAYYKTHQRGEVYRYGVVFINNKGEESFVKWIGDIKIPNTNDGDGNEYQLSQYTSKELRVNTISIEFTLNAPENPNNDIIGYKIVRVERKPEDMSRLGTGITGGFEARSAFRLSIADLSSLTLHILGQILKVAVSSGSAGILAWLPGSTVYDKLFNTVSNIIQQGIQHTTVQAENITIEIIEKIVEAAFGQTGGSAGVTTPVLQAFGANFVKEISHRLMEEVEDYFSSSLVAGIDTNVLSLGKSITDTTYSTFDPEDDPPLTTQSPIPVGYIISPSSQFDFYKYKLGDYIRILAQDKASEFVTAPQKFSHSYYRKLGNGLFTFQYSTASYRKWYDLKPITDTFKNNILINKMLEPGEILRSDFSDDLKGYSVANAYINEVQLSIGTSPLSDQPAIVDAKRTFGIGDRKHFVVLDATITGPEQAYKYEGDSPITTIPAQAFSRKLDGNGDCIVSYERYLLKQYGGNSYSDRTNNEYIQAWDYEMYNIDSFGVILDKNRATNVYGDAYMGIYGTPNYSFYFEQFPGYHKPKRVKKALAEIFPVECPFNFNVRERPNFLMDQNVKDLEDVWHSRKEKKKRRKLAKHGVVYKGQDDKNLPILQQRFVFDTFKYNWINSQENNVRVNFHKPFQYEPDQSNEIAIYYSDQKIYGEFYDSFRRFRVENGYFDLDTQYGPINAAKEFNNTLFFFQNTAMGELLVQPISQVKDSNSLNITLGTGDIIQRHKYISLFSGCQHKGSIVNSDTMLLWYDNMSNSINTLAEQGVKNLSMNAGIQSYLSNYVTNGIGDNPTILNGISSGYNSRFDEFYFTFLNSDDKLTDFTIVYNEILQKFTGKMSFLPTMYLNSRKNLYSFDPASPYNKLYKHDNGDYGNYYGIIYPSTIEFIINPAYSETKTFDNINYHLDASYNDLHTTDISYRDVTFDEALFTNDYQSTGSFPIYPKVGYNTPSNANTYRAERTWKMSIPRDQINQSNVDINDNGSFTTNTFKSRMRDKYLRAKFTYNNNLYNSKSLRVIIPYFITDFRVSPR